MVDAVLNGLYEREHWITVIHGGARGADRYAREWATRRLSEHPFPGLLNIYVKEFPADWETHAKAAGPIRNRRMLEEGKPELVLAFKNGFDHTLSRGGTENMGQASESARCGRVPGGCVVNDTDVREADLWTRRAPMTKQKSSKQYVR